MERLADLAKNPNVLIPQRLLEIVDEPDKVFAAYFHTTLGHGFDNQYTPTLAVLIAQADQFSAPVSAQEKPGDHWNNSINLNRNSAICQKILSERSIVLTQLIAHEVTPTGIHIKSYIQIEQLRGRGVGRAFFRNFDQILSQMGYEYYWGENSPDNVEFFKKLGRYTTDLLNPNILRLNYTLPGVEPSSINTIRFLDESLKQQCLKSEQKMAA